MQQAHLHLVSHAIDQGHNITVWDGEEDQVFASTSIKDIVGAIESVEESELTIRDSKGIRLGWALVIDQGQADETVCDYTCTPFMEAWNEAYDTSINHI